MKFEFSVIRNTFGFDEHTVIVEADSIEDARRKAARGEGDYVSLDRDEMAESKIFDVRLKAADRE